MAVINPTYDFSILSGWMDIPKCIHHNATDKHEGLKVNLHAYLTSKVDWDYWLASRSGCFTNDESEWVGPRFGLIMVKWNIGGYRPLTCYTAQTVTTCSHSNTQRSRSAIFVVIAASTLNFTREIFFGQYMKIYNICHIWVPDLIFLGKSDGVLIIQNPVKSVAVGADFNIESLRKSNYTLQYHLPRLNIFVCLLSHSIFLTASVSGTNEGRFGNTSTSWKHLQ